MLAIVDLLILSVRQRMRRFLLILWLTEAGMGVRIMIEQGSTLNGCIEGLGTSSLDNLRVFVWENSSLPVTQISPTTELSFSDQTPNYFISATGPFLSLFLIAAISS
jgi:hypothetical protein